MISDQLILIVMFILNFFMIWRIISYKESRFGLVAALDIFAGLAQYVVISGFFFWIDRFSVLTSVIVMSAVNCGALAYLTASKKFTHKNVEYDLDTMKIAVLTVGLLLCVTKFGYYGMGQDQGVYQVKAIDLMHGSTERVKDFEEFHGLSDSDKKTYYSNIRKLAGYDLYDVNNPMLPAEDKPSEVAGIYHGIPTYAAMLALFGEMFGMKNMMQLHTYIYIGYILMLFYICGNLKMNKLSTVCSVLLSCLSPIVIWISKSSLTEMYLSLIISVFLFCITATDDKIYTVLSCVPICVFSFFHVTIYTMLPMFAVIYIYMYIVTNKKRYILSNTIASIWFIVGICMMGYTSPSYTTNNIMFPFQRFAGSLVNVSNCIIIVCVMSVIFAAAGAFFVFFEKARTAVKKFTEHKSFAYIVTAAVIGLVALCVYNLISKENLSNDFPHLFKTNSLVGAAYLTGIVVLPVVLCALPFKCRKLLSNNSHAALLIAFVYCILFRAAVLSTSIDHYYYYARYWAPYIAVIALMLGVSVTKPSLTAAVSVISAGVMLPYDLAMFSDKDDTRFEWETLEDICKYMDQNDAVIVDSSMLVTCVLPVKEITDADIFFLSDNESAADRASHIKAAYMYENIYVLTGNDVISLNNNFSYVYDEKTFSSDDRQRNRIPWIPFPYSFDSNEGSIYLFEFFENTHNYTININETPSLGFDSGEIGFAWSTENNTAVCLNLSPEQYKITIEFPRYIPFGPLEIDSFPLEIFVNGNEYSIVDLVSSDSTELFISPEDIEDNRLMIEFYSELWSPSQYGASDARTLGFAVGDITIEQYSEQ